MACFLKLQSDPIQNQINPDKIAQNTKTWPNCLSECTGSSPGPQKPQIKLHAPSCSCNACDKGITPTELDRLPGLGSCPIELLGNTPFVQTLFFFFLKQSRHNLHISYLRN